jgi:hypothetical protein
MSKMTQYPINDNKVCVGFSKVSLKRFNLHCKKSFLGQKNMVRGCRSGKNLVLL